MKKKIKRLRKRDEEEIGGEKVEKEYRDEMEDIIGE